MRSREQWNSLKNSERMPSHLDLPFEILQEFISHIDASIGILLRIPSRLPMRIPIEIPIRISIKIPSEFLEQNSSVIKVS